MRERAIRTAPTERHNPNRTTRSASRNPATPIPNPESRIPNPESRIPNPESRIPNPALRTPLFGPHASPPPTIPIGYSRLGDLALKASPLPSPRRAGRRWPKAG
ncbi:MAG: hypothetical protein E6Q50_05480 [Lysobacter sp.]|nr:MAG: hypothetical protein E6Q50_05480 [Lysobacter sp.]